MPTERGTLMLTLKSLADRFESADFLIGDPSYAMHSVHGGRNQEVAAFIASCLSYGSRAQFLPKIEHIMTISARDTYSWVAEGRFTDDFPPTDECFYRLYKFRDMNTMLQTLRRMITDHHSIGEYVRANAHDGFSALQALTSYFAKHGSGGIIPKNTASPCKRLCMFLRWMVRDASPVDLGLWSSFIDKRTLIIPMDTHVIHEAAALGLLNGRSATMAAAIRLTQRLAKTFPDDPLKGDFALFGRGVYSANNVPEAF